MMNELHKYLEVEPMSAHDLERGLEELEGRRRRVRRTRTSVRVASGAAVLASCALALIWTVSGPMLAPAHQDAPLARSTLRPVFSPQMRLQLDGLQQDASTLRLTGGTTIRPSPGAELRECATGAPRCHRVLRGQVEFQVGEQVERVEVMGAAIEAQHATFVVRHGVAASGVTIEAIESSIVIRSADGGETRLEPGDRLTTRRPRTAKTRPAPKPSLWTRAGEARRAGKAREAAALYQQMLDEQPHDARTGVAALELARLRMDTLGQWQQALAPLRVAMRDNRPSVREDALARMVTVYDKLGQPQRCEQTKQAYLKAYAKGVHRRRVERLCLG